MTPRISTRAPMAIVLIGLIAGLILARYFETAPGRLFSLAFVGSLITLFLACKKTANSFRIAAVIVSATFCFWGYGNIRLLSEPPAANLALPQREARLTLEVKTLLSSTESDRSANVIACVLRAPEIGRLRDGDRVYAQLRLAGHSLPEEYPKDLLQKGLQLQAAGLLTPIPEPLEDGSGNDFNRYLKNIGVHYRFDRISELKLVRLPSAFTQFCAATNQHFQMILQLGAPAGTRYSELANIYITMLLGDSSALNSEQRDRYRVTGTMHFFAISGLHIGVIATTLAQCLGLMRVPRRWRPWIGLPLLYLYVEITGASPSAMRAFLMVTFFWASFAVRRQNNSFAGLVNSAVVVLIVEPNQLWSLGFQLSYTVVASILLLGLPLSWFLKNTFQPYRWLPKDDWTLHQHAISYSMNKAFPLLAISFSAWLASLPLCATFFGFIVPVAIVLNTLLVCLVAIVIVNGVLSLGFGSLLLLHPVSEFINHAAWLLIFVMDEIVRIASRVPNISFPNTDSVLSYLILAVYFLSLFWLHHHPDKLKTHQLWIPAIVLLGSMVMARVIIAVLP